VGLIRPLDGAERLYVDTVRAMSAPARLKGCYQTCQSMILNDHRGQLHYHEGWWCGTGSIPVHHAWLSINGKVVDPTAELIDTKYGAVKHQYFGVEVDKELLRSFLLSTETHSGITDTPGEWLCRSLGMELDERKGKKQKKD
jgi:hypothetical protein